MDFQTWLAFFAASCLIAVSPGSGAVLSMSHGLSYGVRKASATILGLQLGLLLILVIAGAGVGSLLLASEVAFSVVKVAGACYLIYVGFSQRSVGRQLRSRLYRLRLSAALPKPTSRTLRQPELPHRRRTGPRSWFGWRCPPLSRSGSSCLCRPK